MQKTTKTVYITSDKQEFASEAEAQAHEIDIIEFPTGGVGHAGRAQWIVAHKDEILSILGARRRVRSDKGKKRQKAEVAA